MDFWKLVYLSFGSAIVLFILTKLMGRREMGQLSMFDYVVGITIGSIAAEMATSIDDNFLEPLIAMVIYAIITLAISIATSKSIWARRILTGKSMILLDNGELYRKNFKRARLDVNEFLAQCRTNGYFNVNDLQTVILEPNGKMSFIPKSTSRPTIPQDFNIMPEQEQYLVNVVVDGKILEENLKRLGYNKKWLENKLNEQNIKKIEEIFLATCDNEQNLSVYVKLNKENKHDSFE